MPIEDPRPFQPKAHALFSSEKMQKVTLREMPGLLVGLNCFQAGQSHRLHTHDDMDKVYVVLSGEGSLLLEGGESPLEAGSMVCAERGEPHGIRADSEMIVAALMTR